MPQTQLEIIPTSNQTTVNKAGNCTKVTLNMFSVTLTNVETQTHSHLLARMTVN